MPKKLFAVVGALAVVTLLFTGFVSRKAGFSMPMMDSSEDIAIMREPAALPSTGGYGMGGDMGMMVQDKAMGGITYPYPYYPDDALNEEQRVLLQSANQDVVVGDIPAYVQQLKEYFSSIDARVLNTSMSNMDRYQTAYMHVKVPVNSFDAAVDRVGQGVEKVINSSISSDDVTGTVVSQAERVAQLEEDVAEKEAELAGLTENTAQWRVVQLQLNRLRDQLEAAQRAAKNFGETTQYATITIQAADSERYFKGIYQGADPDFGESAYDAWMSLRGSLMRLVVAVIWLAIYSVLWAPVVALVWWIWKKRQAKK